MNLTSVLVVAAQASIAVSRSGKSLYSAIRATSTGPIELFHGPGPFHKLRQDDVMVPIAHVPYGGGHHGTRFAPTSPQHAFAIGEGFEDVQSSGRILVKRSTLNKSLAFLAGVADVLCFNRHDCYATMMTGNTIRLAASVVELRLVDAAFCAVMVLSYVAGFGAYHAAHQLARRRAAPGETEPGSAHHASTSLAPVVVVPAVLALFALYDALSGGSADRPSRWLAPLLSVGSGLVNAAGVESTGAVTWMMTGHLQKLANYAAESFLHRFLRGPRPKKDRRRGARKSANILTSFASGVALATAAVRLGAAVAPSSFSGRLATSIIGAAMRMPPFTVLGVLYALLLLLYGRPIDF